MIANHIAPMPPSEAPQKETRSAAEGGLVRVSRRGHSASRAAQALRLRGGARVSPKAVEAQAQYLSQLEGGLEWVGDDAPVSQRHGRRRDATDLADERGSVERPLAVEFGEPEKGGFVRFGSGA